MNDERNTQVARPPNFRLRRFRSSWLRPMVAITEVSVFEGLSRQRFRGFPPRSLPAA